MFVALLRGVNVGGRNIVPMADLRSLCLDLGWTDVATYIQSGNVLFESRMKAGVLERKLEKGIEDRFGISTPVVVRSATEWEGLMRGNPFPGASVDEPNLVMAALSKKSAAPDAAEALARYAVNGEAVVQAADALWIHFPQGSGRSKITPTVLDRVVASPVTMRNWRTVVKLGELVATRR